MHGAFPLRQRVRLSRSIPVTGSDFELQPAGEAIERGAARRFQNKGGTAYYTPFANNPFAKGFFVSEEQKQATAKRAFVFDRAYTK